MHDVETCALVLFSLAGWFVAYVAMMHSLRTRTMLRGLHDVVIDESARLDAVQLLTKIVKIQEEDDQPRRIIIPDDDYDEERCRGAKCNGYLEWREDEGYHACTKCGLAQ